MLQVLAGIGLLVLSYFLGQHASYMKGGEHFRGQVTSLRKATCHSGVRASARSYACSAPTITFTDSQGRKNSFEGLKGDNYAMGQSVPVLYRPGSAPEIDDSRDSNNALIIRFAGGGLVLNGLWVTYRERQRRRKLMGSGR